MRVSEHMVHASGNCAACQSPEIMHCKGGRFQRSGPGLALTPFCVDLSRFKRLLLQKTHEVQKCKRPYPQVHMSVMTFAEEARGCGEVLQAGLAGGKKGLWRRGPPCGCCPATTWQSIIASPSSGSWLRPMYDEGDNLQPLLTMTLLK